MVYFIFQQRTIYSSTAKLSENDFYNLLRGLFRETEEVEKCGHYSDVQE